MSKYSELIWDAYAGGLKNRDKSSTAASMSIRFPKHQKCAVGIRKVGSSNLTAFKAVSPPVEKLYCGVGFQQR